MKARVWWWLPCLAAVSCGDSTVDDLFGPFSQPLDSVRQVGTSDDCGDGGGELAASPQMTELPQATTGGAGGMAPQLPSDSPKTTSSSVTTSSASTSASSSTSSGGAQCLTCEVAVDQFRAMRGAWEGFCSEPDAQAWSYTYTCLCDPNYGGCHDDCKYYCSGDRGPVPAGSACDACTRDHRGKCGAFLNNCSQASEELP